MTLDTNETTLEPADQQLVDHARQGGAEQFVALMRRHNPSVYRVIRSVIRDEAEVEDVMQDTYVIAFTHLKELGAVEAFTVWLRRIAFREALRRVRRARSSPFSEVDVDEIETRSLLPGPDRAAGGAELKQALERAIDALPDGFREVFVLRAIDGCSVTETAEALGLQEETVRTRFFRARGRLQETLAGFADYLAPQVFAFPAVRCDRVANAVLQRLKLK
jgi:RNA polymerase sigma-70 factor (ECF subfamily)